MGEVDEAGTEGRADLALADEVTVLRATVARLRAEAATGVAEVERARMAEQLAAVHAELSRVRELLAASRQRERGAGGPALVTTAARGDALAGLLADRDAELAAVKASATWRIGRLVVGPLARLRRLAGRGRR